MESPTVRTKGWLEVVSMGDRAIEPFQKESNSTEGTITLPEFPSHPPASPNKMKELG